MSNKIKIKAKSEVGLATTSDIEVEPTRTIRELKDEIAAMQACDANGITLQFQGKILDENSQVKDCSIKDGDVISVVPRNRIGGTFFPPALTKNRISLESQMIRREGINLHPVNPFLWRGTINGRGRWYGKYKISISLQEGYPYKAPKVKWETLLSPSHPNISPEGTVCLNILSYDWRPQYTLVTVYRSLEWLLANPHFHEWDHSLIKMPRFDNTFFRGLFNGLR